MGLMDMAVKVEIRSGAYYDSVILMQLQRSLAGLPGVLDVPGRSGTNLGLRCDGQHRVCCLHGGD